MQFCGLDISTQIGNAAGPFSKTLQDVQTLANTKAGIITVGSITVQERTGNPEPRWYDGQTFTLNSFGLPNAGLEQYKAWLPQMVHIAHAANKPVSVSIAGFSLEEYIQITEAVQSHQVDLIELNLSCPNVKDHQLLCFQPTVMQQLFNQLSKVTQKPLLVKLSPYSNPAELARVAELVNKSGNINGVVCSNSFPYGYFGQNALAGNLGGVGGSALLPIALGQVRQFRQLLNPEKVIVGLGGVQSGSHVQSYLTAGASLVQAASHLVRHGLPAINDLVT